MGEPIFSGLTARFRFDVSYKSLYKGVWKDIMFHIFALFVTLLLRICSLPSFVTTTLFVTCAQIIFTGDQTCLWYSVVAVVKPLFHN